MNHVVQAKLFLAVIILLATSFLAPVYIFAETGSVSVQATASLTSASADNTLADARERLNQATAALTTAQQDLQTANSTGNAEAIATAKTKLAEAEKEEQEAKTALETATTNASASADKLQEINDTQSDSDTGCSYTSPSTWFTTCIYNGFHWLLSAIIIGVIAGPILVLAGLIFDTSLYFSIIKFPDMLRSTGADGATGSSIYSTWIIVRNLFNIIIVFQLLKIAIYKILSPVLQKSGGDLKRLLMSIIIFTLFVNFSFFFTKALIDISNITALQFYSGMGGSLATDGDLTQGNIGIAISEGLGIKTKNIFQLDQLASESEVRGVTTEAGKTASGFEASILGTILLFCLLMLASLVLIQGAAIFISRSVMLIFLVVLSPLMFAKGIIGFVDSWSKDWWDKLLEQLFVAPLYLGMLFLTLKMAGNGEGSGILYTFGKDESFSIISTDFYGQSVTMILQAAIMAGLFMGSVSMAKKFGGKAAQSSSKWGSRAYGAVVGGTAGKAGRSIGGRVGNRIGNNETIKKWASSNNGIAKTFGTGLLNVGAKAKTSSFDIRGSSALKSLDAAVGGRLGLKDMGAAGGAGGFVADRAAADKKREDKLKARQALLATDTYGMTDEQKKAAEKADRGRQNNSLAIASLDSQSTEEELEKLKKNIEGLEGAELETAKAFNDALDKQFKKVKRRGMTRVLEDLDGISASSTGSKTSARIAREALVKGNEENNKLKEKEAADKRKKSINKLLEEFSHDGEDFRDENSMINEINTELSVIEGNISRMDGNSANLTDEQKADIAQQKKRAQILKASKRSVKSWVKNRDDNSWKTETPTPNPPVAA